MERLISHDRKYIMITITEKYEKWCEKVRSGSCSLLMLIREKGAWYLIYDRQAKRLSDVRITVCDGDDMTRTEYTDATPTDNECILLIKDEKKLIMSRGEKRLDAFGMESSDSTAKMVFCYARTAQVHILISAHRNSSSVNVLYYPVGGENDAISLCMQFGGILPLPGVDTEVQHE